MNRDDLMGCSFPTALISPSSFLVCFPLLETLSLSIYTQCTSRYWTLRFFFSFSLSQKCRGESKGPPRTSTPPPPLRGPALQAIFQKNLPVRGGGAVIIGRGSSPQ